MKILIRIKLFLKILKAFYRPQMLPHRFYCVEEFKNSCIVFKSNPYYFDNMGSLMISYKRCDYSKLPEEYVFFPVPIYRELYKIVNNKELV